MASGAIGENLDYAQGLARAFGGALLFAFPLMMTMEMWQFGFAMEPLRLGLFLLLGLPMLYGLSHYAGFRDTTTWQDEVMDALAAYGVGFVASALLLGLFAVIGPDMPPGEIVGKVAIQALPASIGAMVARSQFSDGGKRPEAERRKSYGSELFLMAIGAVFVAFNVAPTEEVILIGYQMTPTHAAILAVATIGLLHIMVFSVGFAGQEEGHGSGSAGRTFLHFTLVGYAIALSVSLYILWTFHRVDDGLTGDVVKSMLLLAFPAAVGAAAARLLV